jgi:epsilon-lactone hydrolase
MSETPETLPRTFLPCASISKEANEFMSQSIGAQWEMADFSPAGIATLRRDNRQIGTDGWEITKKECSVTIEDEIIGGVSCQWVSPSAGLSGSEIVLFLYGGAFVVGGPEDDISMTARIASSLGRRVCIPRYRLAPENPCPAARDDIFSVYSVLSSERREVLVVGESAGGNLALGLVLHVCNSGEQYSSPLAVALLSPWIDLTHSGDSHTTLQGLDPTLSVQHFLNPASLAYAGKLPLSDPSVSPLFAEIPTNFPPTLISTATRDLLLSDCVRLAHKLRAKNCTVDFRIAEGLWHVYEWYPRCPESAESLHQIATFLKKHCKTVK